MLHEVPARGAVVAALVPAFTGRACCSAVVAAGGAVVATFVGSLLVAALTGRTCRTTVEPTLAGRT